MDILTNIPIEINTEQVAGFLARGPGNQFLHKEVAQAVEMAREWVRPASVFAWGCVSRPDADTLQLEWQGRDLVSDLHLGPHADLMADAAMALVSVTTIGPELDAHARRLHQAGKTLPAYLLDCVGVIALGQAGQVLRRMAEERAAAQAWGVGPSLGPGSLAGWDLKEQPDLCAGLDLDAIGVRLNASGVLVPHKSASGLIGLGPDYRSPRVGSVCRFCMLSKSCWRAEHDG
jgi:hypothetical protein